MSSSTPASATNSGTGLPPSATPAPARAGPPPGAIPGAGPGASPSALLPGGTGPPPGRVKHGSDVWRRLRRNRAAMAGLGIVILLIVTALFAPWLA
ncbi:MAG: hypothetical protein AB1816_08620, partial [Bacillota bacterium]